MAVRHVHSATRRSPSTGLYVPILIALKTLHLLTTCDNILDPAQQLKISRFEVYRIMAASTLTGGSRSIGTAYWGHLRKTIG